MSFKRLVRETSVYNFYIELKEDVLTKESFFDLVKVPNLFIFGAGKFLKNLRQENNLTQYKFAKLFNISRSYVNHLENNRPIPLQLFVEIAEANNVSRNTIYSLIDKGEFRTKYGLPVDFKKISDIVQHLSPTRLGIKGQIIIIKCSNATLSKIKSILNVKLCSRPGGKKIYSKELHKYLKTFFRYTKIPKISFPLTPEVKLWQDNNIDLRLAVICPFLQSDGSIKHRNYNLKFHGLNKILHDYFVDAMYYEYGKLPSSYLKSWGSDKRRDECYDTVYVERPEIVKEIMELAGNTKTKPAVGQSVEEYLNEPQPHLNYLIKASDTEQKIALRIWASAEGFVSMYKRNRKISYVSPLLGIACAHPNLVTNLQQIAKRFRINFAKIHSKSNWSGIWGLSTTSLSSCLEFLKLGGFIKDVKISSHSKYHKGVSKDTLICGIFEFRKRQNTNQKLRNLPNKKIHDKINEIIENRLYNKADYYINLFS